MLPTSYNDWADFWRYQVGVNVIPANTKEKKTWISWSQYQDNPITQEQHEQWKRDNAFKYGMAIILGKVWHATAKKDLYLAFIDLDNQKAIDEFCTREGQTTTLNKLAEQMIVECHKDDLTKAHIYCYTRHPLTKKSSDRVSSLSDKIDSNEIPALEVKGLGSHGIAYCTPSPHKNGHKYEIIGTIEPEIFDDIGGHIDLICRKYGIPYLDTSDGNRRSLVPIGDLFREDTKIYAGRNRHEAVLRIMDSLLKKLTGILPREKIKQLAWEQSHKICDTPLEETELERQWKYAVRFIEKKNQEGDKSDTSEKNHSGSNSDNNQTGTNAQVLVELANNNSEQFFKDQYGSSFSVTRIGSHCEVISLESNRYRRFLSKLFYDHNEHDIAGMDTINNVIQILQAKAEYESPTIPLSLRVAWTSKNKDTIYYDLTDEKWRAVKIDKKGWMVVNNPPTLFVRYNQTAQVEPSNQYDPRIFEKFLVLTNIKDPGSRLLLKVYIITAFIPDIPHAMLILHGEKGSAKSTLQTLIKMLVDPGKPILLTVHNDRSEFIQQLAYNHIAYYDNIKYTQRRLSDEACKAVTGVGQTKRKLYTNDEDIVYEYKRCLGFNGINISLTEPDALDRSIVIELDRISKERREIESAILAKFEELQPALLGSIFDTLSKALAIKDDLRLQDLPRMADFALWGEAIARAMGYKPLEFINAYYNNIGKQNIEAIEAHPLGQAIVRLSDELSEVNQTEWFGSTAECLQKLNEIAEIYKIDTNSRLWPKATNSLSRNVNRIRSNLLEGLGIEVIISRVTTDDPKYRKNTSTMKIWRPPPPPPSSPLPPLYQKQARFSTESDGDIVTLGDMISPQAEIPPLNQAEDQAQNTRGVDHNEDSGGCGSYFPKRLEESHEIPCQQDSTRSKDLTCDDKSDSV